MRAFLLNVLLAIAWTAVSGEFGPVNLLFGFLLGFAVLAGAQRAAGSDAYVRRAVGAVKLFFLVLWDLVRSNLRVAYDVVTPHPRATPAIVAVPLDVESDLQILLLAVIITLTPGDMALDLSADRKTMYFYGMYVDDIDRYRQRIKRVFEAAVLEATR